MRLAVSIAIDVIDPVAVEGTWLGTNTAWRLYYSCYQYFVEM